MSFIMRPVRFAPTGYIIEGSGLFDGSSGFLTGDIGSDDTAGNKKYHAHFILKYTGVGTSIELLSQMADANNGSRIFISDSKVGVYVKTSSLKIFAQTTALLRDPSAFYVIDILYDSTQAALANGIKVYVNGSQVAVAGTYNQNTDHYFYDASYTRHLGRYAVSGSSFLNGYLARAFFNNGVNYAPTAFGEIKDSGFWQINEVKDITYSSSGFLLEGGASVAAGADISRPDAGYAQNDSIPTMTGTSAPSGEAIFDSESSPTYAAWKAFDKSTATRWARNAAGQAGWIGYDFGTGKVIKKMIFTAPNSSHGAAYGEMPKNYTLQAYNGSAWVTLQTITNAASYAADEKRVHTFTNTTAYNKYRVNITTSHDGANCTMGELNMFEGGDGVNHFTKTGTITATNDSPTSGDAS